MIPDTSLNLVTVRAICGALQQRNKLHEKRLHDTYHRMNLYATFLLPKWPREVELSSAFFNACGDDSTIFRAFFQCKNTPRGALASAFCNALQQILERFQCTPLAIFHVTCFATAIRNCEANFTKRCLVCCLPSCTKNALFNFICKQQIM